MAVSVSAAALFSFVFHRSNREQNNE